MKVNAFGMLISLVSICAVSNFAFLSAAELPLSNEPLSQEVVSTASTTVNTTVLNEPTKSTSKSNSEENASVEQGSTVDTLPPLIFPMDDEKILPKNETALKILQSVSGKSSSEESKSSSNETVTETRTAILQSSTDSDASSSSSTSQSTTESSFNSTTSSTEGKEATEEDYDNMSDETENIQENNETSQDELEEQFGKGESNKTVIKVFEDPVTNEPTLHNGHIALIFASTLVILSVIAYVGLILWRSRLESRYGMSQRLVTEDDYYNNNDVRYFGL